MAAPHRLTFREEFQERVAAEAEVAAASLPAVASAWAAERSRAVEFKRKPNYEVKFAYAFALSRSSEAKQRRLGCALLVELLDEDDPRRLDYHFALAFSKLIDGDLKAARYHTEKVLWVQPDHQKGQELHQGILVLQAASDQRTNQVIGIAAAVGVGVGALIVGLASSNRRGR